MSSLGDKIRDVLIRDPAGRAIEFKGQWRTWGDLGAIVAGLEAAFAKLGLPPGAAVGCALRNRPEHAAMLLGVVAADRCVVTFNALLPDDKLAADIEGVRPVVVVASADDWERPALRAAAKAAGAAGLSLTADPAQPVAFVPGLEAVGGGDHQAALPDVAILMLTSGTTGTPKRVPLRAAVLERQLAEAVGGQRHGTPPDPTAPTEVSVMHSSLVHIAGVWGLFGAVVAGRPTSLLEKFTVEAWRDAVVKYRPRASGLPPTALRMILDADLPKADLASLLTLGAGTARVDPAVVDEFMARYDLPILSNYGATEFAGGVASWSLNAFRQYWSSHRGAAGRIHNGVEARVIDPQADEVLPLGQEGILELRSFSVGDGQSWVRTTDIAMLDAERFLWIRGRADNAINRGGFKVHPDEVVKVLESHPSVREASVVGMAHRRLGEAPVAAIILKSGAVTPTEAELGDWVRGRLMAYSVPVAFRIVEDLPRTPSMKVSMPGVRELFADEPAKT